MEAPAANVDPDRGRMSLHLAPAQDGFRGRVSLPPELEADAAAIVAAVDTSELTLTDQQRAILDFERLWWRQPGAKEQAIRDSFEMSPTRYYQTLNALLDLPQALNYDATLVNRLQRLRTSTTRGRRLR